MILSLVSNMGGASHYSYIIKDIAMFVLDYTMNTQVGDELRNWSGSPTK